MQSSQNSRKCPDECFAGTIDVLSTDNCPVCGKELVEADKQ